MNDTDVLIIGGGISGLSTAWWLNRAGLSVNVWESGKCPGGKIQSRRQDGYLTEQAAALVMNFRPEVAQLVQESGLEAVKTARLPEAEAHRYLLHDGQLIALPMRLGRMVCSPLWSWRAKLRLLTEPFIPPGGSEDETVSGFVCRRLGREVLEKAMEPFVAGTLAADPDLANAAATLPRLTALERRYGSLAAGILVNRVLQRKQGCITDTFSFHGGMSTLVDTLSRTPGVCVATSHTVNEIAREQHGWRVTATTHDGQRSLRARQLVLTVPAGCAARLVNPLDAELAEQLTGIRYAPKTVVHLGMDRTVVGHPLDGTGFLVPRRENQSVTGNLWMSTLFSGRAPRDKVLLTAYLGGARAPATVDWDDGRIIDAALAMLRPVLRLKGSEPDMVRIDRHREALPLYHGAYQARMQAIDARLARLPGLHLVANYRGGVSVRDRITSGYTAAQRISADLGSTLPMTADYTSHIGLKLRERVTNCAL
jgi:oxygen-dependent protoporphyrinogen oxidase